MRRADSSKPAPSILYTMPSFLEYIPPHVAKLTAGTKTQIRLVER